MIILMRKWRDWVWAGVWLAVAGCAGMPGTDPLWVNLAGVDSLPSEGLEVRMAVKLRIQNPNDAAVNYDGAALTVELRGVEFATGVSDAKGSVPRFGETVLVVPVTVSAYAIARQILALPKGERSKLNFVVRGKLAGSGFGGTRFESTGEFELPTGVADSPSTPARN
jgi:hypothetical protein